MIGTIDIKINSAHPNMALDAVCAFVDSPITISIANVGTYVSTNITSVYLQITYPIGIIEKVKCVKRGSLWIGTLKASTRSGESKNGFQIIADGVDENGNDVTGYVLGVGDVLILPREGTISVDEKRYSVRYCEEKPEEAGEGDLCYVDEAWKFYNGKEWIDFGFSKDALKDYYTKSEIDNKIPTKVSQLENDKGYLTQHQSLSNYYTKNEVNQKENQLNSKITAVDTKAEDALGRFDLAQVEVGFTTANKSNLNGFRYQVPSKFNHDDKVRAITLTTSPDNTSYSYTANVFMLTFSIDTAGNMGEYLAFSKNQNALIENNAEYTFNFDGFKIPDGYGLGVLFTTQNTSTTTGYASVRLRVDNNGSGAWYQGVNGAWYANFMPPMKITYSMNNVADYVDEKLGDIEEILKEING